MSELEPQEAIEIDHAKDDFLESMSSFQEFLDEKSEEVVTKAELDKIKRDLNRLCPYIGDYVDVNGMGYIPNIEGGELIDIGWYNVRHLSGLYEGVDIITWKDEDDKQRRSITHKLLLGSSFDNSLIAITTDKKYYARMDVDTSIVTIEEMDANFQQPEVEKTTDDIILERLQIADQHSCALNRLLAMQSFKDLEPEEQFVELDEILEISEEAFGLRGMYMGVQGFDRAFSPLVCNGKLRMSRHNIAPGQFMGGVCMGLSLLNRIPRTEIKQTRYTDFPEDERGLCVVIDPDDELRAFLELDDNGVLYFPLA